MSQKIVKKLMNHEVHEAAVNIEGKERSKQGNLANSAVRKLMSAM